MPEPENTASGLIARYYENLRDAGIPEALVDSIVRDAAWCLHRGDLALTAPTGDSSDDR